MVLKETQLIITSGNATSTNFVPNAPQGIPTGTLNLNSPLQSNIQTNPVYIPQPLPRPSTNAGGIGTPVGQANDFYVMLPHPFDNVVKTEVRYFFMENGINNVYPSSAASIAAGTPDGNDTFFIRSNYDPFNGSAGYQHEITIPAGYYDRNALAAIILNLVNQLDPTLGSGDSTNPMTTPSQTSSNPIYNYDATSGTVLPNQNFSACSIGSDGVFRLESPIGGPFSTTNNWAISFRDRTSTIQYTGTQYLLGFQNFFDIPFATYDFPADTFTTSIMVNAPFQSTIDIYNYILIQSQKLGSRVVSTTGVNAHCIIPMSGLNTQVASQTGQFSYDGGNFTLDANYFDFPRRLDVIDIRLADSSGALLDIGQNTITLVIRIIQSVV
jgi:hypothetical protein